MFLYSLLVAAGLYGLVLSDQDQKICDETQLRRVRLQGGTEYAGRVEICWQNNGTYQWLTVCLTRWGLPETVAACSQLKYTNTFALGELNGYFYCLPLAILIN